MNRNTIFSSIVAISMLILAACASATTVPTSNNNIPATAPVATSNTDPNVIAPTATNTTTISMDPSLACSGGKTTASTTIELTEGPYYTANTPERSNLYEEGMPGTKLVITG